MHFGEVLGQLMNMGLTKVNAVVISGGEPMLQQKELVALVKALKDIGCWVEIETNGTIEIVPELQQLVDQFNCSPKLSNSGDPGRLRFRYQALKCLASMPKTCFKFVVSSLQDIDEILHLVKLFDLKQVYLMPEGKTKDELAQHEQLTRDLCDRFDFIFSQRLHIIQFGAKRAV